MQASIDAIAAAAAAGGGARPRTFYEIDATGDIYGPADTSFLAEMIRLAGGDPITTGSPNLYSVPLERLIAADPQIILLGDAAYGTTREDGRRTGGLGRDDRREGRRDPAGRRHHHHPARAAASRGPAGARARDRPRRCDPVARTAARPGRARQPGRLAGHAGALIMRGRRHGDAR